MKPERLFAAVLFAAFTVGCGGDDKSTDPEPSDPPPTLTAPHFDPTVEIPTTNETSTEAKETVEALLTAASTPAVFVASLVNGIAGAQWSAKRESCWTYVVSAETCTSSLRACESALSYTWSYTVNGGCNGQAFNNWKVYEITTDRPLLNGTFIGYDINTTNVLAGWRWTESADHDIGSWTFYEDGLETPNVVAKLDFDLTDVIKNYTFEQPGVLRWDLSVGVGRRSGELQLRELAPIQYLAFEILWETNGTGVIKQYDEKGQLVRERTW